MADTIEYENIIHYRAGDTSAIKAAERLAPALRDADKAAAQAGKSTSSFAAELAKVDRAENLKKIAQEQARFAAETGDSAEAARRLAAALESAGANQKELSAAARQFAAEQQKLSSLSAKPPELQDQRAGDISTGLSSLASVAGASGTNPLSEALAIGGDTAGALEYLKVLKENIADFGRAAANSSGLIGAIASGLQGAGLAAGSAAAGLGALAIAAAPFILAAAAITAGISAINAAYAEGARSGERYASAIVAGTQARLDAERLLSKGDAEGLRSALEGASEAYKRAVAEVEAAQANLDQALIAQDANKILGIFSTGFDAAQVEAFQKALDEANTSLVESRNVYYEIQQIIAGTAAQELFLARQREEAFGRQVDAQREVNALLAGGLGVDALNAKIRETQAALEDEEAVRAAIANQIGIDSDLYRDSQERIEDLNRSLSALRDNSTFIAAAANDAAVAEAERAEQITRSTQAIRDLNTQAQALIDMASERAAALQASRALSDQRGAEDALRERIREDADLKAQLEAQAAAHAQRLLAIERDGAQKVADLRAQLAQKVADTAAAIAEAQAAAQAAQAKAQADFDKAQARQLRDFEVEKRRIIEDAAASQRDALLANDVTALLRSQADTARRLSRGQEDFDTRRGDQEQDFAEESAARAAAAQERIEALSAELEAFRSATEAKIAEEQAAIQARLQAEQAGYEAQLAADQDRRELIRQREAEDAAIRQARLIEDRAIEDAAAQAALQKALDEIDQKRAKELEATGQALDGYTKLQTAATLFNQIATSTLSAIQSSANAAGAGIANAAAAKLPVRPFAEGGIVKAGGPPLLGLFERRQDEAVIPLDRMGDFGRAITVNVSAPVSVAGGENLSGASLQQIGDEIGHAIVATTQRIMLNFLNGTK